MIIIISYYFKYFNPIIQLDVDTEQVFIQLLRNTLYFMQIANRNFEIPLLNFIETYSSKASIVVA